MGHTRFLPWHWAAIVEGPSLVSAIVYSLSFSSSFFFRIGIWWSELDLIFGNMMILTLVNLLTRLGGPSGCVFSYKVVVG